jgi:cell wall-associated NlpC family hydrolase
MRGLLIVVAALSAGCAATGATPRPFPIPLGTAEPPPAALPNGGTTPTTTSRARTSGYEISGTALSLRGVPYRNGGYDTSGFDCSGFVWYVFGQHGIPVPRTVSEQFTTGTNVAAFELREGDLVFFTTTSPGASHVGIAVGGDSFVHAPASSGVVRVEHLGSTYWSSRFVGARRITP